MRVNYLVTPSATKTRPNNTTPYSIGQVIADSTTAATLWIFSPCCRAPGCFTGSILGVNITDSAKQSTLPQFNLWLFSQPVTIQNDAVAFAPSAADLANFVACIPISNFNSANANGTLTSNELNRPFACNSVGGQGGGNTLYGVLVAANAYTPVSQEVLGITLLISED